MFASIFSITQQFHTNPDTNLFSHSFFPIPLSHVFTNMKILQFVTTYELATQKKEIVWVCEEITESSKPNPYELNLPIFFFPSALV